MVTNIHVYNVIGNREDCLVNTHHCRCSGVYHLDWRVLDQVNISILDIDLRICEIKLQDFMTSALFWNWCICLHFIFMWYLLKVEFTFFKHNTCINCRYEKKNMKNHLLSELLSFLFHGISSLPAMGKSLFRKFWKSLWIWFLKRHTEWSGVRVWRGRRATEDAWPWPETTDPDICQNRGGEEPTNESTTIFTWVNDWCSLNHLKAEHRS